MSVEININNDVVEINEVNEVVQIVVSGGIGPAGPTGPQGPAGTGTVNSINLTAGTGISVSGGPITTSGNINVVNTSPDQVVSLTGAGTSVRTGTYPNFTITSNDQFNGTVTSVGLSSATSGVTIGSSPVTTSGTITLAIATASGSQNGLLSSTDFTTFNNKQGTISLTTTGTSGAATFSANTLNIPQYSGTNIYNANGSLTSARALTLNAFNLDFIGSTHTNRFTAAGRLLLGTTTESTFLLDVNGTARVNEDMVVNGLTVGRGGGGGATNTAIGSSALNLNSTGTNNVAVGFSALSKNTASNNVAIGHTALTNQTSGSGNLAIGSASMSALTTGFANVGIGVLALNSITSQSGNVAIGDQSMINATTSNSVAIGINTLKSTTTTGNVAIGQNSLTLTTSGANNTAIGALSMQQNTTGSNNTTLGNAAFLGNITGSKNVAIGVEASRFISGGLTISTIQNQSIFIGESTRPLADNQTNQIVIGTSETGLGSNTTIIGNSSTTLTALRGSLISGGTSVNASAQLQIDSTTKGFLPPRMTTVQKNAIVTPASGLMVYDTTLNKLCVFTGAAFETITSV